MKPARGKFFKLEGVTGVTCDTDRSQCYYGCAILSGNQSLKCCSMCKSAFYCSKKCQGEHWPIHKTKCKPYTCGCIHKGGRKFSEKLVKKKLCEKDKMPSVRQLVERKCLIRCFIGNKKIEALWDSGSQVCAIDESWRDTNLPKVT